MRKILQLIDFWFRIPFSDISSVLSLTANNALCAKSALDVGRSNKIFTLSVIPFLAGGPGDKISEHSNFANLFHPRAGPLT